MKLETFALIASAALLGTACVAPEERDLYRAGSYVNEGTGLKAFADAVVAHCAPAIEGAQDFADFEMRGASTLRALDDNKYPIVSGDSLPVWQLAEGIVQVQLDPYSNCEVAAVSLPVETAIDVAARAAKANGYSDIETEPAAAGMMRRTLVAQDGTRINIEGPVDGQTPDGRTYSKITANVTQGAD